MKTINQVDQQILSAAIVATAKILVSMKLDSGPFGNISIRMPNTNLFLVNPVNIMFDQLQSHHLVVVDLEGHVIAGNHAAHPGTFIHREIYRQRSDLNAIVHTHAPNLVNISLLGCKIEPYTQIGASIHADQGIYLGFSGPVRDSNEGHAIAKALTDKSIVIAKSHGVFITGENIQAALWDTIMVDQAASIHLTAKLLGLPAPDALSAADLIKSHTAVRKEQYAPMWEYYLCKLSINA
jgi:ribulose-5-phosphate 4-epimerase/fuculose-1-phosphate aldolase